MIVRLKYVGDAETNPENLIRLEIRLVSRDLKKAIVFYIA